MKSIKALNCECGYSTDSVFAMEQHFIKKWTYTDGVNKNGHKIIIGLITYE
jgi:hypothetical protein